VGYGDDLDRNRGSDKVCCVLTLTEFRQCKKLKTDTCWHVLLTKMAREREALLLGSGVVEQDGYAVSREEVVWGDLEHGGGGEARRKSRTDTALLILKRDTCRKFCARILKRVERRFWMAN
jgi:hypothetical protein